jgi:hypothetical protein
MLYYGSPSVETCALAFSLNITMLISWERAIFSANASILVKAKHKAKEARTYYESKHKVTPLLLQNQVTSPRRKRALRSFTVELLGRAHPS